MIVVDLTSDTQGVDEEDALNSFRMACSPPSSVTLGRFQDGRWSFDHLILSLNGKPPGGVVREPEGAPTSFFRLKLPEGVQFETSPASPSVGEGKRCQNRGTSCVSWSPASVPRVPNIKSQPKLVVCAALPIGSAVNVSDKV